MVLFICTLEQEETNTVVTLPERGHDLYMLADFAQSINVFGSM